MLFLSLYFEIFVLVTYLERRITLHRRRLTVVKSHPDLPGVTIIVPCFNEERTAVKTIQSLLALDYPAHKLHIMAIDDGSTDHTWNILQQFKDNPRVQLLQKENGGKHTVLNMGIARATTPFVGCLDADSYVKPDALLRIIRRFDQANIMAVVPSLHIYNAETVIQRMQKTEYLIGVFLRSILAELRAIYVTPGPFSIFRKSVFEQIGYYRKAHNTEDMEMALRMQSHGLHIASAHDAVVYTSSPRTPHKLYKQRVRWISGFLHNMRDYRGLLLKRQYRHLGGFILPMMLVSFAGVLFVVSMFGYDLLQSIQVHVTQFQAIGLKMFEPNWHLINFNWFFIYTSPLMFTGLASITLVLVSIGIGMNLSHGNRVHMFDIACYFLLYSFIAPFWVIRSLTNVVLSKQAAWR